MKSCRCVIPSRGYNYFRFQSPYGFCPCLPKVALFNIRPLLCATPKTCVFRKLADILFLFEVITASGFGRDTILVIWRRRVPYVVVFVFIEFVELKFAHRVLEIVFQSNSHTAIKYEGLHFTLATAILYFWWMSMSCDTGNGTNKSVPAKTWG